MAGTVLKIKVKSGDQVQAGQELVVLEAMKMETSVFASAAGTVTDVLIKEGEAAQEGQILVKLS